MAQAAFIGSPAPRLGEEPFGRRRGLVRGLADDDELRSLPLFLKIELASPLAIALDSSAL